ncbi:MAG TPA: hypothetical protein VKK79_10865 [Candidatus Lokiarchaeia archaeon]|nr:hypothetical protein [Candidatus Lokiarchaeia archaeon]
MKYEDKSSCAGVVFVEASGDGTAIAYHPGTFSVAASYPDLPSALAFARAEWPTGPIVMVKERLFSHNLTPF